MSIFFRLLSLLIMFQQNTHRDLPQVLLMFNEKAVLPEYAGMTIGASLNPSRLSWKPRTMAGVSSSRRCGTTRKVASRSPCFLTPREPAHTMFQL